MKKLIFTISLLLAAISLQARHFSSTLSLTVDDRSRFSIEVNDQFFRGPFLRFQADELRPGRNYIKVLSRGWGHYPVVLFEGFVQIPANSHVDARIDRWNRFRVVRINSFNGNYGGHQHSSAVCGQNYHMPSCLGACGFPPINGYYGNPHTQGTGYAHGGQGYGGSHGQGWGQCGNGNGIGYGGGYGNGGQIFQTGHGPSHSYAMSTRDFAELKNSVRRQSFEDSQLSIIRQALR
ncbi:MAG: hypothetical protein HKN22_05045, partial [Bacteroidia bacterium]|nr:hypothetical protein [Bacteroidia bacterium]